MLSLKEYLEMRFAEAGLSDEEVNQLKELLLAQETNESYSIDC